jgi:hypothetical protein
MKMALMIVLLLMVVVFIPVIAQSVPKMAHYVIETYSSPGSKQGGGGIGALVLLILAFLFLGSPSQEPDPVLYAIPFVIMLAINLLLIYLTAYIIIGHNDPEALIAKALLIVSAAITLGLLWVRMYHPPSRIDDPFDNASWAVATSASSWIICAFLYWINQIAKGRTNNSHPIGLDGKVIAVLPMFIVVSLVVAILNALWRFSPIIIGYGALIAYTVGVSTLRLKRGTPPFS